ncbi:MAG: hypothetical protein V3V26_01575 [Candidatus Aenigmarchaeota archaeon]
MDIGMIRVAMLVIAIILVAGVVMANSPELTGLLTGQYELQPDWSGPNNMVTNSEACRAAGEASGEVCMWDPQQFKCVCTWEK